MINEKNKIKYKYLFKINNPQTKDEKLIAELTKDLHEVQKAFVKLNQNCTSNEIFTVLRDSSLGFAGQTIAGLLKLMLDNSEKVIFLKDCQDIFNCYIQQASEDIK